MESIWPDNCRHDRFGGSDSGADDTDGCDAGRVYDHLQYRRDGVNPETASGSATSDH